RFPSLYPPGPRVLILPQLPPHDLRVYYTWSWQQHILKMTNNRLSLSHLSSLLELPQMQGEVTMNALIKASHQGEVQAADILIKSKDFSLPSQKIAGFDLPDLP